VARIGIADSPSSGSKEAFFAPKVHPLLREIGVYVAKVDFSQASQMPSENAKCTGSAALDVTPTRISDAGEKQAGLAGLYGAFRGAGPRWSLHTRMVRRVEAPPRRRLDEAY
jgi:hypothetical protein